MKIVETERIYCFEITKKQYAAILEKDDKAYESFRTTGFGSLTYQLCKIPGVREVSHDPMTGPVIFVRIESEDPEAMADTVKAVKRFIARYAR